MPSLEHQALVALFQQRPALAAELITLGLDFPLPGHDRAELVPSDLAQTIPSEYRADVVVRLHSGATVKHALIVEVQLGRDDDKPWTWPLYVAALRARERVPVTLLVLAPDARVAAWAARPVPMGQPGWAFTPLVMSARAVPVVTEPEVAERSPELAVLSLLAHGHEPAAVAIAHAAVHGLAKLGADSGRFYYDFILDAIGDAARNALESYMFSIDLSKYEWKSDFAKKYIAMGRDEGRDEGREEGRQKGLSAQIAVLLDVLKARGLTVSPEQEGRIRACDDLDGLSRWIVRAATAATTDDVFAA